MPEIDLTIFDCDGVLVDSEIIGSAIASELLSEAGFEITPRQVAESYVGMSWGDILTSVEKRTGLPLASLADLAEPMLDERLGRDVQAVGGVASVLQRLPYPRCVCSNTKSDRLDMMLAKVGLKSLFHPYIFSAKTLGEGRSKPKPDIFLHGAAQMSAQPARTIVIEDSVHGVTAARAAGMHVIGFTGASHTYPTHASRLIESGARIVVSNMADLPAAIDAITGQ